MKSATAENIKKIKVHVDDSEVKKTMKKVKRLRKLLKEANSLADELASKEITVFISLL